MQFEIIPKQETIPAFDAQAIKIKHIVYYPARDGEYEQEQITETLISSILRQIPKGINVILSLDPYGEEDYFEIICDGEWLSFAYFSDNEQQYESYNADFAETKELSPLLSGGQSPVEKCFTVQDIGAGIKAAEYFIRTGKLYPGIEWAHIL